MLRFLSNRFGSKTPKSIDPRNLELELRSARLLQNIDITSRGIPTVAAFEQMIKNLPAESMYKLSSAMDKVASGNVVRVSDGDNTPKSRDAMELLVRSGFLCEDENKELQFASNMHL